MKITTLLALAGLALFVPVAADARLPAPKLDFAPKIVVTDDMGVNDKNFSTDQTFAAGETVTVYKSHASKCSATGCTVNLVLTATRSYGSALSFEKNEKPEPIGPFHAYVSLVLGSGGESGNDAFFAPEQMRTSVYLPVTLAFGSTVITTNIVNAIPNYTTLLSANNRMTFTVVLSDRVAR